MTIEKRIQPKRGVRKSFSKGKETVAVRRYLFQMSDIPWEPHKKRQRSALRKPRREIASVVDQQSYVRGGSKDKLKKKKLKRNANAEFVDLLVLAKSAELLETKGMPNVDKSRDVIDTIATSKKTKKRSLRFADKSRDSDGRIGNTQVEKHALHHFDKLLNATDRIGNAQVGKDALDDVDESLDASDKIGNAQVGKDASRVRGKSRRNSFRHQALMYLGLGISRSIQKDEQDDLKWIEETNIDDTANADQVEGAMHAQDVPDLCVSTERGPKGLEGVRKQTSLVEAVTTNPKELQRRVERDKIIPLAVSMAANNGDYREQSDAFLRKKHRTGDMNRSLNETNPQEHGHAPPCQTESSLTHISDSVQVGDPVADCTENWKQLIIKHNSELLVLQMAESLKEGPSVAREKRMQRTLERRKQRSGDPQPIVLQPDVRSRYILPRTKLMALERGDHMEKGDVTRQLAKDTSAKLDGSLQEKNLKGQQECGHAPIVLPPGFTFRYILPRTAQIVPEHRYYMEQGDVPPQLAKDTTAKVNGSLQGKDLKGQQECGHAPFVMQPGVRSCYILPQTGRVAPKHVDRMEKGDVTRQVAEVTSAKVNGSLQEKNLNNRLLDPVISFLRLHRMDPEHGDRMEKGDVTHQLAKDTTSKVNGSLQEKNLKTQQECGHAPLVLQPGVRSRYILPQTAKMDPKHGDRMEKDVVTRQLAKDTTSRVNGSLQEKTLVTCQLAKDTTSRVNGSLQEKTLETQQKCGHVPSNCETESSSIHLSGALESRNSVALDGGKQKGPPVSQMTKLGNHKFIAHLRQMLKSIDQRTLPRQKTYENEKHKNDDFRSFKATRNYERVKAQQVQGAIHPQDTQDLRVATERVPQGLEGARKQASLVEAATKNTKEFQPCVGPDKIIPQAVGMTVDIGYPRMQSDASLRRKDSTGSINRSLNENNPKPLQEHGHVPPNCQTEPSPTQISNAAKDKPVVKHGLPDVRSDKRVEAPQVRRVRHLHDAQEPPVIGKSGSNKIADIRKEAPKLDHMEVTNEKSSTCDAHQLTEDPCVATERNPIGLEGLRKQASLVEAATTNTEELQPYVESDKITPPQISPFLEWLQTAVRMTANIRDSREQSDACNLTKDRTGSTNDNCETVPLGIHLSDSLESQDSVALKDTRSEEHTEAQHVRGTIHPQDTQDLCVTTKQVSKGLEGIRKQAPMVEATTKNTKEVQPFVKCEVTIPRGVRMTENVGDPREISDACLQRKNRSGNMNGSLNEDNPKPPQVHGQAPPNCQNEPSLTHMPDAVEEAHCDAIYCEKLRRQLLIQRSGLLANKLAELLKEGPSVARQKRILRISERRKRRSGNPQPVIQQTGTEHGDCMEKDQLAEDTTANVNGSLQENNLHCETEPSLVHVSAPLENRDSVALVGEKKKYPTVSQTPKPLDRDIADIIECYRQKTKENEKSENPAESKSIQEPPVIDELAGIMKQASLLESMEVTNENLVSCDTQQITEEVTSAKNDSETIPCEIRGEKRKLAEDENFSISGGMPKRIAMGQLSERLKDIARDRQADIIACYRQKTNENEKSENPAVSKSIQEPPVIDELAGITTQTSLLESMEVTNENPVSCDTQQIREEGTSAKNDSETTPCEIRGEKRKLAEDENFSIRGGMRKRMAMGKLSERLKDIARDIARDRRTLRRMIRRNRRNGVKSTTDLNWTRTCAQHKRKERRLLRMRRLHGVDLPATVDLHRSKTKGTWERRKQCSVKSDGKTITP